ncbi:MAG: response regulator [Bacteroidales bacterium]|nr:response regulator [Bacteroidales bacterium]
MFILKMDGVEAINQIRNVMPNIPIIVHTAFSEDERLTLNHVKCNEILRKPINGDEYCETDHAIT